MTKQQSPFNELYTLHLQVESIAHDLRERSKKGWAPLKKQIEELYDISMALKILDKKPPETRSGRKVQSPDGA
jgi:hypothetical protein